MGRGSRIPQILYVYFYIHGRGRLLAGEGLVSRQIGPSEAWVSYPPKLYMYILIYMDLAVRRVRVPSPKIVSNTDGARVSYPPKLLPLFMGRGSRIPPMFGFFTPCGSSTPVSVHGFRPCRLMGRGSRIPRLMPFICPILDGARVSYFPNVALLHRVGLVSR